MIQQRETVNLHQVTQRFQDFKISRREIGRSDRGIVLTTIAERYGINSSVSIEECYEALILQAQWINLTFARGTGKRKTQLQRVIET